MRTLLLFALMAPITAFAQADFLQPASMARTALSAEQASTLDVLAAEPTVASQTLVYVDTAVLRSAANMRSRVPGFLDAAYALDRIEERTAGDYSWFGTGADELRTTAVLVVRGDRVTGTLRTPEGLFSLRALGGGLHTLLRIDEGAFPPDHGEDYASIVEHSDHAHADHDPEGTPHVHRSAPATSERRDAAGALTSRSVAPTLGVVVGYTPSAKNQVGGTANIEAIAQLAVDETNAAFAASGILARLSLNHVYETADDNSTSFSQDLNDFTFEGGSNPKFDGIEALRDTYDGDFAVLLRASGGSCGIAWLTASVSRAFSVTAQNCATGNYTFGHEIGHNIGMRHNKEEDPNLAPYAYAHGLLNVADDWRTILSYNSGSCPGGFCSRLQRFSTPSETFGGVALGDETRSNNARVLNQRADEMASFKGSAVSSTLNTSGPITVSLDAGASTTETLTISNGGAGSLYWEAGTSQADGAGSGSGTYTYVTSDDPSLTYSFIDIATTGTPVPFATSSCFENYPTDDESFANLTLPFSFPFFGSAQSTVRVSNNGYVSFNSSLDSCTRTSSAFPSVNEPDGLIAPYWDDLLTFAPFGGETYSEDLGDGRFVIQWSSTYRWATAQTNTFQMVLYQDGRILFQYQSMEGVSNDFTGTTVGLENLDGTKAVLLDYREGGFVDDNFAVEFTPATSWLSVDRSYGVTESGAPSALDVTIDGTNFVAGQTYTGWVTLISSDTGNTYDTVPVTVNVNGGASYPQAVLDLRGTTLTGNGLGELDRVGTWADLSGNSFDATAVKARRQPVLRDPVAPLADQPAVFFNTKTFLTLPAADSLIDLGPYPEKTTTLVIRTSADVNARQVIFEQGSDERGQIAYIHNGTLWVGAWNLRGAVWGPLWLSTPVSVQTPHVLTFTLDSNAGTFAGWLDGVAMGSQSGAGQLQRARGEFSTIGGVGGTSRFSDIGGGTTGSRYRGFVAELRQWNAALSTAERGAMEGALFSTYGISGPPFTQAPVAASAAVPEGVRVEAFPNPTRGATTVRFGLDAASAVRVVVYDALGREVAVLADGMHEAGWHAAQLEGHALASGLYVLRVETGATVVTKRLSVLR